MQLSQSSFGGSVLSNQQLRQLTPSAFAAEPFAKCSARYAYIPTVDVIDGLRENGFVPTFAKQSAARSEEKR